VRDNEPLTIVLTAQLCGRGENKPGRRQKFKREPYVETLSLEEQDACGQIGMMKALSKFDPKIRDAVRAEHGLEAAEDPAAGLPAFAAWRIKYELQAAIEKAGCITLRRGVAPQDRPGVARLDDPEYVETALEESAQYLGGSDETLGERLAREEAEDAGRKRERPKSALEKFLNEWCDFGKDNRVLRRRLVGAYEYQASMLGFPRAPGVMERRLAQRGALLTAGNVAGQGRGDFWKGVRLRSAVEIGRVLRVFA
jgi:hypothetical protein